jgi:competence protein ComEC
MGDADEASESRLLASGIDLQADALKVGHHGSRYASTPAFITAVGPSFAIISAVTIHSGIPRRPRLMRSAREAARSFEPIDAVRSWLRFRAE